MQIILLFAIFNLIKGQCLMKESTTRRSDETWKCNTCNNINEKCLRKCDNEGNDHTTTVMVYNGTKSLNEMQIFSVEFEKNCIIPSRYGLPKTKVFIQKDGTLYIQTYDDSLITAYIDEYCVEIQKGAIVKIFYTTQPRHEPVVSEEMKEKKTMEMFHFYGMAVSIPFLLVTFIVYALLPEKNLHMEALINYVINLMMSYILLIVANSEECLDEVPCYIIGFGILFFFLGSCFWMNVICIDIWLTFRGLWSRWNKSEERRYWYYFLYAYGTSAFIVTTTYIINEKLPEESQYSPGISATMCYLKSGIPQFIYCYGPMAILISLNSVLFVVTAHKIRSVKKDTAVLKKGDNSRHFQDKDKQTFFLYLRLLFAMGLNWSFEIIFAVLKMYGNASPMVMFFPEFLNALYGVIIFFMFVFKRNIWKQLKKRYYYFFKKPYFTYTTSTIRTSRITNYSSRTNNSTNA